METVDLRPIGSRLPVGITTDWTELPDTALYLIINNLTMSAAFRQVRTTKDAEPRKSAHMIVGSRVITYTNTNILRHAASVKHL